MPSPRAGLRGVCSTTHLALGPDLWARRPAVWKAEEKKSRPRATCKTVGMRADAPGPQYPNL